MCVCVWYRVVKPISRSFVCAARSPQWLRVIYYYYAHIYIREYTVYALCVYCMYDNMFTRVIVMFASLYRFGAQVCARVYMYKHNNSVLISGYTQQI